MSDFNQSQVVDTANQNQVSIRVYFDSQIFLLQRFGGISNYFNNLIDTFIENPDLGIIPLVQSTSLLNSKAAARVGRKSFPFKGKIAVYGWFYLVGLFSRVPDQADVIHRTYYSRLFKWGKKPNVTTLFDMIPEATSPQRLNPHLSKKRVLSRSECVLSISQSALDHAEEIWKWRPNLASVAHLAANLRQATSDSTSPVPYPYLLVVGQRALYKRGAWALRAAAELPPDWKIVFAGPEFSRKEHALISNLGIASKVICLQPSDEKLGTLYKHALALLHTTEIEGFGLPVLEAMGEGTPVILGRNAINTEVAGDLGIYFHNNSFEDFLSVVKRYAERPLKEPGSDLAKRLREHSEAFTWHECARLTALAYQAVLKQSKEHVKSQ